MKISFKTYFLVFLFTNSLNFYAQNLKEKELPLIKILTKAEKQYNVTFTYANKLIKDIEIGPYHSKLSLKETVTYLKNNTQLDFIFLTKTNILIRGALEEFTICGYLVDTNSNTSLQGAHITVLNSSINTVSNSTGYFTIPKVNENHVIQISHISYPTIFLNTTDFLINKKCLTVLLKQKIEHLSEVVIENYLTSGISIKTDNSITINTEKFGILPGLIEPDVLHQIQALPGINSVNETISNINIRGGTNDQNLLLWDGIKMYHSGHFFGLISAFNPYLTQNVTVIKNGTSSQYNDAVSGTISIESKDNIAQTFSGGAGFNLLSADVFAKIPVSKKASIQFSGRRSLTDFIDTPTFQQYFDRAFQDSKIDGAVIENTEVKSSSDFNFFDVSFKFLYNINKKHKLRLSLLNVENNLNYNETIFLESNAESKTSKLRQQNVAFGAKLKSNWSKKFNSEIQTYYTNYTINSSNHTLLSDQILLQDNKVLETGIKLNTNYKLTKQINWLNGYHFYETGIENAEDVNTPLFRKTIKNVIRNHSIYSELSYKSKHNTVFFNAGVRVNYIEKFNELIAEPRLQFLYKLNKKLSIKAGGEFKSQNVTQIIDLQEDFLGVEKRRWTLADNKNIPIIKSKQGSTGLNFTNKQFSIDLEGFYKTVKGISASTQGFQNQYQNSKTSGSYNVYGVEFLVNKKSKKMSTWLGYTYNKNNYTFKELSPSKFPNSFDIRHVISFGNTYKHNNLKVALGVNWHSGKPTTIPVENKPILFNGVSNSINFSEPNNERLSDYFRADISSTYQFRISKRIKATAGISVLNLLNSKNIINTYYSISNENTVNKIDNYAMGITPNFTFRTSF